MKDLVLKIPFMFSLLALFCHGAEFDVDGRFTAAAADNGLPKTWRVHDWDGYLPTPKLELCMGDFPAERALRIGKATAKYGMGVMSNLKHSASRGDLVDVTLCARGKGTAWVTLVRLNEKGEWNQTELHRPITLTEDWATYNCPFVVHDYQGKATKFVQVEFGLEQDAEGCFTDITFDHVPATEVERAAQDPKDPSSGKVIRRVVETVHEIELDDFESSKERKGSPKIIQDHIAPGLLSKTSMGVYTVANESTIPLAASAQSLPANGDEYLAANARIYNFGADRRTQGEVNLTLKTDHGELSAAIQSFPQSRDLLCVVKSKERQLGYQRISCRSLPADFTLGVSKTGQWIFNVTSLSDSSVHTKTGSVDGFKDDAGKVEAQLRLVAGKAPVAVALDNLALRHIVWAVKDTTPPLVLDRAETFDPVQAGWPLVFADEFEGTELDWNKWFVPWYRPQDSAKHLSLDGKGRLVLKVEKNPTTGKLETTGIWSKDCWRYGYFEARLRFTRKRGWWSAFWLYGIGNRNPFWDGFEIDIQEDYYTRRGKQGESAPKILDHNLHVNNGMFLKSWNYNSPLPGTLDDFYTLGCKWTPFEITYYLNGKRVGSKSSHSPYDSVTFDAFHHAYGLVPLHAIVSGQIMKSTWTESDITGVEFPEEYLVDWVRVYKYPEGDGLDPEVRIANEHRLFARDGERLIFEADAKPGAKGGKPLKAVYLFDNGYMLDFKAKPPYRFEVPFKKAFYNNTRWMKPGRSGKCPEFDSLPHLFTVAAQDEGGRVGHSDTVAKVLRNAEGFTPYAEGTCKMPGFVPPYAFDEGGAGVAYHDLTPKNEAWSHRVRANEGVDVGKNAVVMGETGEWLNYTVEVVESGRYRIVFKGASERVPGTRRIRMYQDSRPIGDFRFDKDRPNEGRELSVNLVKGRHTFTILLQGPIDFHGLDFSRER